MKFWLKYYQHSLAVKNLNNSDFFYFRKNLTDETIRSNTPELVVSDKNGEKVKIL